MRTPRLLASLVVALAATLLVTPLPPAAAATLGNGPVGWDTYRQLDQLPYLSGGVETRQFSSFDRAGGNGDGSGTCLAQAGAGCVLAEDRGPGEIDDIWFTRDQGVVSAIGTIRVELDGVTVLNAPLQDVVNGALGAPWQYPLVANGDQSPGGVYLKVPMTYRGSMRVSVQQNVQYYHVGYRHFPSSAGVATFDPTDQAQDVLAVLRAAGTADPKPAAPDATTTSGTLSVPAGGTATVATLTGPASVSALRLQLPGTPTPAVLAGLRLRISFDGHATVDSPVGEFFGSGLAPSTVRTLLFSAGSGANAWYSTWWPMPFAQTATITLANTTGGAVNGIGTQVTADPDSQWTSALANGTAGYFTTQSHAGATTDGQDWSYADVTGHGKFVGVATSVHGGSTVRGYLEGDERVYADGSLSPQVIGTGTEDFYEGGWYFRDGVVYSDPLTGQPAHETGGQGDCTTDCTAMYRLMLGESVGYDTALRFGIEHGEFNQVRATYSSTAFLYTQQAVALHRTDRLDVTDAASRSAHGYTDSGAGQAELTAQYEGDDDAMPIDGQVRSATGAVSFTLAVDGGNAGVLLRRTGDQNAAYQSAAVAVDGTPVGTWLEARGNSRQRWLADTFPLPASTTAGKSGVTVTLSPTSGAPAWTASRYVADSLVAPYADTTAPATPTGLTVTGTRHAVRFQWPEPTDGSGIRLYQVYSSPTPDVPVNTSTLLGTTRTTSYARTAVAAKLTRYYRVVAIDPAGNASAPSAVLTATSTARLHTDVNGDGRDDVLTFTRGTAALVYGATSTGTGFTGTGVGWGSGAAPGAAVPVSGDFNGDGRDDVAWFTRGSTGDVYVQLSGGSGLAAPVKWHDFFCVNGEVPLVGDFNGDGLDDIATFTRGASGAAGAGVVYVALSTGSAFAGTAIAWAQDFGYGTEPPAVGDFNGDGLDDIATFAQATGYVYVGISNGARFLANTGESVWNTWFAPTGETPAVGDVTGDGRDDIVTFTQANPALVWVGVSTGTGFAAGTTWSNGFSVAGEVPGTGDFDGDGKSDVVTFTRGTTHQVYVSLSDGTKFVQTGWLWHGDFCVNDEWPLPSRLLP